MKGARYEEEFLAEWSCLLLCMVHRSLNGLQEVTVDGARGALECIHAVNVGVQCTA